MLPQLAEKRPHIAVGIRDAGHQVAVNDDGIVVLPVLLNVQHMVGQQVHHGHAGERHIVVIEQEGQQFFVNLLLGDAQLRNLIQLQQKSDDFR